MEKRTLRKTAKAAVLKTKPTMKTRTNSSFHPTKKALSLLDFSSNTDVNGSYTGNPKYGKDPVQDADDL